MQRKRAAALTSRVGSVGMVLALVLVSGRSATATTVTDTVTGGSVVARIVDPAGEPLAGTACLELWTDAGSGTRGSLVAGTTLCDVSAIGLIDDLGGRPSGATADGRADGVVAWTGLAAGPYVVVERRAPSDGGPGYQPAADGPVSVISGALAELSLRHFPVMALTVDKRDPAGAALLGACFALVGSGPTISACDGADDSHWGPGDGDPDGVIVMRLRGTENEPGIFTLRETRPPDGYTAAADRSVEIAGDRATATTVTDTVTGGSVVARIVDPAGEPLAGTACLELWTDAGSGTRGSLVAGTTLCDVSAIGLIDDLGGRPSGATADGRADGVVAWTGLAAGPYVVVERRAPSDGGPGYQPAADGPVSVISGALAELSLRHFPVMALTVDKRDPAGAALLGACFALVGSGPTISACDGADDSHWGPGDGDPDGVIVMRLRGTENEPGIFTLRETRPPDGYTAAADRSVEIAGDRATATTVTDTVTGGSVVARIVDPAGEPLAGTACLELWTDAGSGTRGSLVAGTTLCDVSAIGLIDDLGGRPSGATADGRADGVVAWTGLAAGPYLVVERRAPSDGGPGYQPAADGPVSVISGALAELSLRHFPVMALTVDKRDPAGAALLGACFALVGSGPTISACDGADDSHWGPGDGDPDGVIVMRLRGTENEPGIFTLRETRPPDGYTAAADRSVEIAGDRATATTVTDTVTGGSVGTPTTGGGAPIIGLELEIDSTILITSFMGAEADGGHTSGAGHIALEGNATAGWHGTGTLASTTVVHAALSCQTTTITGMGTYDWVVFDVHAGPSVAAEAITVDMDSGTINESPDKVVTDACGTKLDDTTMNTWENIFFVAHSPTHYKANGFRVDGWRAVGGPEVWATGGVVAEATWTGKCNPTFGLVCTDHTTFRLTAVITGTTTASGAPTQTGGGLPVITPLPLPGATGAGPTPGATNGPEGLAALFVCTDILSCLTSPGGLVIGGTILLAVIGGTLLIRLITSGGESAIPLKAEAPAFNATADVPIEPLDKFAPLDKLEPADKFAPLADKWAPLDKIEPADKFAPLDKIEPADKFAPLDKLEPLDASLPPLEAPSTNLPPPPGSTPG